MTMKSRILKRLGHFTISLILMSLVLPLTHAQSEPFYKGNDSPGKASEAALALATRLRAPVTREDSEDPPHPHPRLSWGAALRCKSLPSLVRWQTDLDVSVCMEWVTDLFAGEEAVSEWLSLQPGLGRLSLLVVGRSEISSFLEKAAKRCASSLGPLEKVLSALFLPSFFLSAYSCLIHSLRCVHCIQWASWPSSSPSPILTYPLRVRIRGGRRKGRQCNNSLVMRSVTT